MAWWVPKGQERLAEGRKRPGWGLLVRRNRIVRRGVAGRRKGAASLDYVLILAVILPLVAMSIALSKVVMGLAYEVLCVVVSWPFM